MIKGLVMVAFEKERRPAELSRKKNEFVQWITGYQSIPDWPTGAKPDLPCRDVQRVYGPYFSPNYNLLFDVDVQDLDQLKKICTLAEAHCHISGYSPGS